MNVVKVLVVLIGCLITTACSVNTTEMGKRKAEYLCKDKGGVHIINNIAGVQCNTGNWYSWNVVNNTIMPVEYVKQLEKTK